MRFQDAASSFADSSGRKSQGTAETPNAEGFTATTSKFYGLGINRSLSSYNRDVLQTSAKSRTFKGALFVFVFTDSQHEHHRV